MTHRICFCGVQLTAVFLLFVFLTGTVAEARNVPGSSGGIQKRLDRSIGLKLLNRTSSAIKNSQCQYSLYHDERASRTRDPENCIALGVDMGILHFDESPDGFTYDFTSFNGAAVVSFQAGSQIRVSFGVIGETGNGDTAFNQGTIENRGLGIVGAVSIDIGRQAHVRIVGGHEWLDYEITRSNGRFTGSYEAERNILSASVVTQARWFGFLVDSEIGLTGLWQRTDGYRERDQGVPGAYVAAMDQTFFGLTSDTKVWLSNSSKARPYAQVTSWYKFTGSSEGTVVGPQDQNYSTRVGLGVDFKSGQIRGGVSAGATFAEDDYSGVDGSFKLVVPF